MIRLSAHLFNPSHCALSPPLKIPITVIIESYQDFRHYKRPDFWVIHVEDSYIALSESLRLANTHFSSNNLEHPST